METLAPERVPHVSSLLCQTQHSVLTGGDLVCRDTLHYHKNGHSIEEVLAQLSSFAFAYENEDIPVLDCISFTSLKAGYRQKTSPLNFLCLSYHPQHHRGIPEL